MGSEGTTETTFARLRLGISACLLGERVRYDGGHKYDPFVVAIFGPYVEWVAVCPEAEAGLGVPREPMRLVGDPTQPRLVTIRTGVDLTERMRAWAEERAAGLDGFVFKSRSPSSGLLRVPVYDEQGMPVREGRGLFAGALVQRLPLLPAEEAGRLHDARLRENFVERAFASHRWQEHLAGGASAGSLVRFHSAHKLTLLSHSPKHYRELGRIVARAGTLPSDEVAHTYGAAFFQALAILATAGRHANVMQHLMGYVKDTLDARDKAELLGLIDDYRRGLLPLIMPVTMLKHHLDRHPVPEWVHRQVYLNPYPSELMLRNHV
ncbi:MAG: YbgA family protein [Anaerolineae bacterium]